MISNISYGCTSSGAILYNENKVAKGTATRLGDANIFQGLKNPIFHKITLIDSQSQNNRVADHVFHASLSVSVNDKSISDNIFLNMAHEYMMEMGYSTSPYTIYRHNDTKHAHIHIVSSRVSEAGKLINQKWEFYKSKEVTTKLEEKYGLLSKEESKEITSAETIYDKKEILSKQGIKSYISAIISEVKNKGNFTSFSQFSAMLNVKGINVKLVKNENNTGILYSLKDRKHKPIKASSIYHNCKHEHIKKIAEKNSKNIPVPDSKLKNSFIAFNDIIKSFSDNEVINHKLPFIPILSRYEDGKIYGVSFIEKETGKIFKASQLIEKYKPREFLKKFEDKTPSINLGFLTEGKIGKAYHKLKHDFGGTLNEKSFLDSLQSNLLGAEIINQTNIPEDYFSPENKKDIEERCKTFILNETTKAIDRVAAKTAEANEKIKILTAIFQFSQIPFESQHKKIDSIKDYLDSQKIKTDYLIKYLTQYPSAFDGLNNLWTTAKLLPEEVNGESVEKLNKYKEPGSVKIKTDIFQIYKNILIDNIINNEKPVVSLHKDFVNDFLLQLKNDFKHNPADDLNILVNQFNDEERHKLYFVTGNNLIDKLIAKDIDKGILLKILSHPDFRIENLNEPLFKNVAASFSQKEINEVVSNTKNTNLQKQVKIILDRDFATALSGLKRKAEKGTSELDLMKLYATNFKPINADYIAIADIINSNESNPYSKKEVNEAVYKVVNEYSSNILKSLPKLALEKEVKTILDREYKSFITGNEINFFDEHNFVGKFANDFHVKYSDNEKLLNSTDASYPNALSNLEKKVLLQQTIINWGDAKSSYLANYQNQNISKSGAGKVSLKGGGYSNDKGVKKGDWTKDR